MVLVPEIEREPVKDVRVRFSGEHAECGGSTSGAGVRELGCAKAVGVQRCSGLVLVPSWLDRPAAELSREARG